jgi:excisionase family DNA binding protein
MMRIMAEELIGTAEAGRLLGMSDRQVLNYIRDGILPAKQFGGSYAIRRADLAKVPKDRKRGPKPGKPKKKGPAR